MSHDLQKQPLSQWLCQYSVPLIAGVLVAMLTANLAPQLYHKIVHGPVYAWGQSSEHTTSHVVGNSVGDDQHAHEHATHANGADSNALQADSHLNDHADDHADNRADGQPAAQIAAQHDASPWAHYLTMHFFVNDIFMVFFFAVAAKEITEACLPGGALNPPSKAINPLCGTVGGVLGPVAVFLGLNAVMGDDSWSKGWGIPTATDIALAWLVAKFIFGARHPATSFLLLLAVADDAIGLGIIAVAYPDPMHPTEWMNALWILPGMLTCFALRRLQVQSWLPYILIGGLFAWWGLFSAHLHPALALVFIVPFIPGPKVDLGLYTEHKPDAQGHHGHDSPLERFEHAIRGFVDFGLFFFAFANAGVSLGGVTGLTWIVLASLLVGKMLGITFCSYVAHRVGFPLPDGMNMRHLIVASVIAGLGLTVALFVSEQAFTNAALQGAAKMGALFSVLAAVVAAVLAAVLGIGKPKVAVASSTKEELVSAGV